NRSVRPHEPPLVLLCPTLGETLGDDPLHAVAILGVHARHEPVVAGGRPDWDADEAALLIRPGDGPGREVPLPAADVCDCLGLGELPLAAAQPSLGAQPLHQRSVAALVFP